MTLTGFVAYSAALALAVAVPGPGIVAMVARGLGSGFRATLPFTVGIALGDLVYLTAAVLGLAFIAQTFGLAFMAIKYAGAAICCIWQSSSGPPVLASAPSPPSAPKARLPLFCPD